MAVPVGNAQIDSSQAVKHNLPAGPREKAPSVILVDRWA